MRATSWARVRASAIFLPASVEADADFRALAAEAGAAMRVEALRAPWGPIGIAAFVAEESAAEGASAVALSHGRARLWR